MNIEEILDDMDDLLDRSRPIPFAAHKAVIDADRMRELLNSAHLNIPAEIKRAKLIDSDCDTDRLHSTYCGRSQRKYIVFGKPTVFNGRINVA